MKLNINIRALQGKKVLVAPLDWGLGHATRCIPVIRNLLEAGCDVSLAGEGAQEVILKKEFPGLPFIHLRGYRIQFDVKPGIGKILIQISRMLNSIRFEKKWLTRLISQQHFDAVISDNRYGLHHPDIHSIFITHQLQIKSPFGKWSEAVLKRWNYHFINQFRECWVPDGNTAINLAGDLSHPEQLPKTPIHYIGPLSRFEKSGIPEKPGHLLIILSGPEPQRTKFEKLIISQLENFSGSVCFIRGLPGSSEKLISNELATYHNHLNSRELNDEMEKAEFILSRAGYSTVMDLVCLGKKSILIPTPGQTEQEYLARSLHEKQLIFAQAQEGFSLSVALESAKKFNYQFLDF